MKRTNNLIALLLTFAVSISPIYTFAQSNGNTWTPPACTPPNCNTEAPINVGSSHQTKLGSLSINTTTSNPDVFGLDVFGISRFFGNVQIGTTLNNKYATISIVDGNQAEGKVLTSDANGTAGWRTPTGGGAASSPATFDIITFTSSYDTLMRNSEFRAWFINFTNGSTVIKPSTGTGSGTYNYEGWSDSKITADKLCNFFTNNSAVSFTTVNKGSNNNNYFTRWDKSSSSWKISYSSYVNSIDINTVSCLANTANGTGIVRGSSLSLTSTGPKTGTTDCSVQTYKNGASC